MTDRHVVKVEKRELDWQFAIDGLWDNRRYSRPEAAEDAGVWECRMRGLRNVSVVTIVAGA